MENNSGFLHIGESCSMNNCGKRDFLPFICDCCNETFCLEHRTYSAHNCSKSGTKSMTIIKCPLCKANIRLTEDKDANQAWEEHHRSGECDQIQKRKKKKKQRCTKKGCSTKLTPSNKIKCNDCREDFCLTHRFPDDHNCTGHKNMASEAARKRNRSNNNNNKKKNNIMQSSWKNRYNKKKKKKIDPNNTLRGSAQRRNNRNNNNNNNNNSNNNNNVEVNLNNNAECPFCQKTFNNSDTLIAHIENKHPDNGRRRNNQRVNARQVSNDNDTCIMS